MDELEFRPLRTADDRHRFSCGNPDVDEWFRLRAGQAKRRGTAAVTVGIDTGENAIASFYALVAHRVELEFLEGNIPSLRRRYPMPAILIAQLGVDRRYRSRGVGDLTLADALAQILVLSTRVGFEAIVVDPIDHPAVRFYERHGFDWLDCGRTRQWMPVRRLWRSTETLRSTDR